MEIGTTIITIVDKKTNEGLEEIEIPKGTLGTICEIYPDYVLVEIWGEGAPTGVEGVFAFEFEEFEKFEGSPASFVKDS